MNRKGHDLVEKESLVGLHLRADLEELMVSDKLPRAYLKKLFSGHLNMLRIESEDGVVADLFLRVEESLVALSVAVDEVREVVDIEGDLFSLLL